MVKYRIIANPGAGHGKGAHAIPEIEQGLRGLHGRAQARRVEVVCLKGVGA